MNQGQDYDSQAVEIDGMWVWPDGFTFPVIRGGSDEGEEGGSDGDDGGGDEGGESVGGDDGGGAEGAEDDEWQIPEGDQFPRAVVEDARRRYGDERMKRKEYEQKLEEWGGLDTVSKAIEMQRHLQTEDGVLDLFVEAGKALGFTAPEMRAWFEAQNSGGAADEEEEDRVLTLKEARELIAREAVAPVQQREEARLEAQAKQVVAATCQQLGITPETQGIVLQLGDKYWDKDLSDPSKLQAAIKKGHEEYMKLVQAEAERYRKTKKEKADALPKTPNGAAGSAGIDPTPPKSVEEAIIRARKRLGIGA